MIFTIKSLIKIMSLSEKNSFRRLSIFLILVSFLDTLGIASILPFFSLAANPQLLYENKILNYTYSFFDFNSTNDFLIFLGFCSAIIFILSTTARVFTQKRIFKFAYFFEYGLMQRILKISLEKNYEYFITKHSSLFIEKILSRIEQIITGYVVPSIFVISYLSTLTIILTFLFVVDFKFTSFLVIIITLIYAIFNSSLGEYVTKLGKRRLFMQRNKFKIFSELINGIKEIKLINNSDIFLKSFSNYSYEYAKAQYEAKSLSIYPKLFLELFGIISVILIILFNLIFSNKSFVDIIAYLSVYVLATYKILPSIQQLLNQNVVIRYNQPALNDLIQDYKNLITDSNKKSIKKIIKIEKSIHIKNASYRYPDTKYKTLKNLDIEFFPEKSTAIVGPSGAGKSTLIEILIGLLTLKEGKILIDGKKVNSNNKWVNNFSVVPQTVYLLDDTVMANIAFGIESKDISLEKVKLAAKISCLDNLIENQMPQKYNSILGERGINLSGGQRQRIAIARAIYRESRFIIFDEATSELDLVTEKKILSNIKKFKSGGVISIAHRISTIKDYDQILLLKNGSLLARGRYDELMNYDEFKEINLTN